MKRILATLFLVLLHQVSFAQSYYKTRTQAEHAANTNNFVQSVELYRQSFQLHAENREDFYQAARAASQAHDAKQAYMWLNAAIRLGFRRIEELQSDEALQWLRNEGSWSNFYASFAQTVQQEKDKYDIPLQKQLLQIWDEDQKIRNEYGAAYKRYGPNTPQLDEVGARMIAIDKNSLIRIREIIAKHGWVTPEKVGRRASNTLFLVIQHSELEVQKEFLPMIRDAVKNPLVDKTWLCYIEDRIAVREGRKQLYGTQEISIANREPDLATVEDPDNLEERRARAGLPPLKR